MQRRHLIGAMASASLAACAARAPQSTRPKTYVLVHGAWHGAWCWSRVADPLRAMGHRVFTPTQTGLGERRHLLSAAITLDTFVADVTNLLEAEELEDVILVGHSFGGITISGVADQMPGRIRHLVYLDSILLQPGESLLGSLSPEAAAARRKAAADAGYMLAAPAPAYLGVPDGPDAEWVRRRMTPHPANTWDSPIKLAHPIGNGRPTTYIACVQPQLASTEKYAQWARQQPGWVVLELRTGHDAMVTAPGELTRMLEAMA